MTRMSGLLCFVLLMLGCGLVLGQQDLSGHAFYEWDSLAGLDYSGRGCFVGESDGVLMVAGGMVSTEGESGAVDVSGAVWVYEACKQGWRMAGELPAGRAYGAAVSTADGLVLIGGRDEGRCYGDVWRLRWDKGVKELQVEVLPGLGRDWAYGGAALVGQTLYVMGGVESLGAKGTSGFWAMDMSGGRDQWRWRELGSWPDGVGRVWPVVGVQNNGSHDCIYIFGGYESVGEVVGGAIEGAGLVDGYRYDPFEPEDASRWTRLADLPVGLVGFGAVRAGQTHLMVLADVEWAYHTITDTWVSRGALDDRLGDRSAVAWGDEVVVLARSKGEMVVLRGRQREREGQFGFWNYVTLGGYLVVMVLIGFYFSRRENTTDDFFLGGRRIPWWAAGLSIYATTFSAISYIGTPAKVYSTDWLYFVAGMATMPVLPFVIYYFLPFVRKLNVTTAYEYLEKRFNVGVRLFGSAVFILYQLGRMAIVLLLPALALATVTGLNVQLCILTMGVLCILYTVLGGIEAVIWTDVLQMVVLLGAAIMSMFIMIADIDGGLGEIFRVAGADGKFQLVDWSWDYTVAALWVCIIGNSLSNLSPYVTDQSVVQRYMTTSDEQGARRSLWFNFWMFAPNAFLYFMLGTALYVFYKLNPGLLDPTLKTDAILPLFVVQKMPAGVSGLVIAGVFAASMSSLDSAMHSVATALVTDFYRRFRPEASDGRCLSLARWLTGLIGVFGTASAMYLAVHNVQSLWDLFMKLLGLLGGGICGVFMLGIFTRRANGFGALVGAFVSAGLVFWAQTYTRMHFFLYGAVGLVSAMLVGYVVSLMAPGKGKDIGGLTVYTIKDALADESVSV